MTETPSFGLSLGMFLWTSGQAGGPVFLLSSAIRGWPGSGALYEEVPRALHSCAKLST